MKRKRPLQSLVPSLSPQQLEMLRNTEKHRDDVVSQGMETLREVAADPQGHPYRGHAVDAILILSYLEVETAHDFLLRLSSLPDMQVEGIIGVLLPHHLAACLYKTCGTSLKGIQSLIKNKKAYIYCRAAAMNALVMASQDGVCKPKETLEFFSTLFTGQEADGPESSFWDEVVQAMCTLHPSDYWHIIKGAIDRGLTSLEYIDERYIEKVRMIGGEEF